MPMRAYFLNSIYTTPCSVKFQLRRSNDVLSAALLIFGVAILNVIQRE